MQRGLGVASRYPLPIIALVALLTVLAAWQATRVGVRANLDELLPQDSEITRLMETHGQSRAQRDWLVLLLEGEDTYQPASLAALYAAMERIEARPEVTATVDPFRFLSFTARGGPLRVERIAPQGRAPADAAAAQEFRRRLLNDPLARGLVVSEDGASLGVLFNVPLSSDYRELLAMVREAVRPLRELGLEVWLAGMQTIDAATRDHVTADLPLLLMVSVLVIMATYYLSFRSLAATLLPVLVVGIATVWTVGSMSALGLDFTIVSVTTPPFVMTLGSAYSVHVLTAYLLPATPDGDATAPSAATVGRRLAAPVTAVTAVAATVILAAVTTAAGFGGLATASVAAVREFGVITGLGIAYCAILALVFLPACLQVLRVRSTAARAAAAGRRPLLAALAAWVLRHRRVIVIVVPAAFLLLGFATLRLRYETDFTRFFRGADTVMDSNLHVQRRLGGFVDFNVTMTGPRDASGAVPAGFFLESTAAAGGGAVRAGSACPARRELELLLRVRAAAHESGADRQPCGPGTTRRRAAPGTTDGGAADGRSGAGAVAPRPRRVPAAPERTRVRRRARDLLPGGPIPGVSGARRAARAGAASAGGHVPHLERQRGGVAAHRGAGARSCDIDCRVGGAWCS